VRAVFIGTTAETIKYTFQFNGSESSGLFKLRASVVECASPLALSKSPQTFAASRTASEFAFTRFFLPFIQSHTDSPFQLPTLGV